MIESMTHMREYLSAVDLLETLEHTPVAVGDVVYPPGARHGPRLQTNVQLILVHTGRYTVSVDDRPPFLVAAGRVGFLLPGHREYFEMADDQSTRVSYVQIEAGLHAPDLIDRLTALPRALPTSSALDRLVSDAVALSDLPMPTVRPMLSALSAAAVWRYIGEAQSNRGHHSDLVSKTRDYIYAHARDPGISLQTLSEMSHVTASHLVRRFRSETGTTPIAALWHRRIEIGIDLITTTGLPVANIASQSGFSSVYHFSRRIKAHTGYSPTELRQQPWSPAINPMVTEDTVRSDATLQNEPRQILPGGS